MNKLDFLRQLDKELTVLDREERRELLAFYEERFYTGTIYEGKTEEEVIAELEHPKVIARNILEEYGASHKFVKTKEERYSNVNWVNVALIICFDIFIVSWLIPTLFSVAVSVLGSSVTWVTTWTLMIGERTTADFYMFAFLTSGYFLLFMFGLVVLDALIWTTKKTIIWHLNVFKIKKRDKFIKRFSHISVDAWFKRHRQVKTLKNLALVASIVGVAVCGLWIFNNYSVVEASYGGGDIIHETVTEDLTAEIEANEIWDLDASFDTENVDIEKIPGTEMKIIYSYYENDKNDINIDLVNNNLKLDFSDSNFSFSFGINDLLNLVVRDTSVLIQIPEDLNFDDADVSNVSGSTTIKHITAEDLDVSNVSGSINITHVYVNNHLTTSSTSGRIYVNDVVNGNSGNLTMTNVSGRINLESVDFNTYTIDNVSGKIDLNNLNDALVPASTITVGNVSGNVELNEAYINNIVVDTVSGNIDYYNNETFLPTSFTKDTVSGDIDTNVR